MSADILLLGDWLRSKGVSAVAMKSTVAYWKPIWNLLEGDFNLMLVSTRHIRHVYDRKLAVEEAERIAMLLEHGLLQSSFVQTSAQRVLHKKTRTRSKLIRQRTDHINRIRKVLEEADIQLGSVVTDLKGASARAIIEALIAGESDAKVLASLAVGTLRSKRDDLEAALFGNVLSHHRFELNQLLKLVDAYDERIAEFDKEIAAACVHLTPEATSPVVIAESSQSRLEAGLP
jgi:transposase